MTRPNFLIGGTEPAGLNFLFGCLRQHSDVYLPPFMQPEPNYFSKRSEYQKPLSYYEERYFYAWNGEKAIGEKSGRYIFIPGTAERVKASLHGVKLIFLLRNPVERAFSNYRFTAQGGFESLSFEEALEREEERNAEARNSPQWCDVLPHAYFAKGLYAEQLERYLAVFPRASILVLQSEALRINPRPDLRRCFRFLEVDEDYQVDLSQTSDFPSFEIRSLAVQRFLRRKAPARLERILMKKREGSDHLNLFDRLLLFNLTSSRRPMRPETRTRLRSRYEASNRRLEQLFLIDMDLWE